MNTAQVIDRLRLIFSREFGDFKGLYLFGSSLSGSSNSFNDIDVILIFEDLNYQKELDIAGIISNVEYEFDTEIDYHLFTVEGKRSIEYTRKNLNPIFIDQAVDNGLYYGRL